MTQRHILRTTVWLTLTLSALCTLGACGAEDDACADLDTEDSCIEQRGCAWGTNEDGPHCFYVGEVVPQ